MSVKPVLQLCETLLCAPGSLGNFEINEKTKKGGICVNFFILPVDFLKAKLMKSLFTFLLLSSSILSLRAQTVIDFDGNIYPTITMGTQIWMKENLKVTHYGNGDVIGTTTDTAHICNESTPKYQWPFGGLDSLVNANGRLYTWYVLVDDRHVCPAGWHVPSNKDWAALRHHLALDTVSHNTGNKPDTALYNHLSKKIEQSGFTNGLGGKRNCGGSFTERVAVWWSITGDNERSKLSYLSPLTLVPLKTFREENNGYAVRCVKD